MPVVPNLTAKLRLLVDYGHYTDMDKLAERFGRSPTTVYWWGHGTGGRAAGAIPAESYKVLVDIVHEALKQAVSREDVEALLNDASAFGFEEELRAAPVKPLNVLIAEEADMTKATLIVERRARGTELIEVERKADPADGYIVGLGQGFRIEFRAALGGHLLALQHGGQMWGVVPHSADRHGGTIHLPGVDEDGRPLLMSEHKDAGPHTFLVIRTKAPIPPEVRTAVTNGAVFDAGLLHRLAGHYLAQAKADRELLAMNVSIERPKAADAAAR